MTKAIYELGMLHLNKALTIKNIVIAVNLAKSLIEACGSSAYWKQKAIKAGHKRASIPIHHRGHRGASLHRGKK